MAAPSRVLVVGGGVIGLRTAVELARRHIPVVVRAPVHPVRDTQTNCSQGAAGIWGLGGPIYCADPRLKQWSMETLEELYPIAAASNNTLAELRYCVSLKQQHAGPFSKNNPLGTSKGTASGSTDASSDASEAKTSLPFWSTDSRLQFQQVTLEQLAWQNTIHKLHLAPSFFETAQGADYHHGWFFQTPIVDCPQMLQAMIKELTTSTTTTDLDFDTGIYYDSTHDLYEAAHTLDCDTIVNCTGYGAAALCNDSELIGGRGILHLYDRKTCQRRRETKNAEEEAEDRSVLEDWCIFIDEGPWATPEQPIYMIIRGDKIIIGGTNLTGDYCPTIRDAERTQLRQNAHLLGIDTAVSKPIAEWVGFRPYRETIRCEIDTEETTGTTMTDGQKKKIRLVHCYGTGSSGWTIYTGLAKAATKLVLQ